MTITNVRVNGTPEPGLIPAGWTEVGPTPFAYPVGTSNDPTARFVLSRALAAGEEVTFDWEARVNPVDPDLLGVR